MISVLSRSVLIVTVLVLAQAGAKLTQSTFPTMNPMQPASAGNEDAFVTEISRPPQ